MDSSWSFAPGSFVAAGPPGGGPFLTQLSGGTGSWAQSPGCMGCSESIFVLHEAAPGVR
jgi:hypothetical protein